MSCPGIQFVDVSFCFPGQENIFSGVNLDLGGAVDGGHVIAILGASGVGKSTFSGLASRALKPTSGKIVCYPGNPLVATIPQRPVLFESLSVRENLSVLSRSYTLGVTFDESKFNDVADRLRLSELIDRLAQTSTLSGGEAQRLMLGRSQLVKPDLILLDEPCASLDNFVKDSFLSDLRRQVDEQRSLAIVITHNWAEARAVADEAIFISRIGKAPAIVHCLSVEEAEARAPSVVAASTVHWPNIVALSGECLRRVTSTVGQSVPANVRLGLLFANRSAERTSAAVVDIVRGYGVDACKALPAWIGAQYGLLLALYDEFDNLVDVW